MKSGDKKQGTWEENGGEHKLSLHQYSRKRRPYQRHPCETLLVSTYLISSSFFIKDAPFLKHALVAIKTMLGLEYNIGGGSQATTVAPNSPGQPF